jgi:hypothetical protein
MGFRDKLHKGSDGKYKLKSKTKKAKKGVCLTCGADALTRNLLYQYNAEDMILVRDYMENHLIVYSNHETIKPIWCEECKALIEYKVTLNNEKRN